MVEVSITAQVLEAKKLRLRKEGKCDDKQVDLVSGFKFGSSQTGVSDLWSVGETQPAACFCKYSHKSRVKWLRRDVMPSRV